MLTKRFLKNVIVGIVAVFMSLVVVQGAQAQQTGLDYQSLHLLPFTGNKQLVLGEFDTIQLAGIIIRSLMETRERRAGCSIEGI